MIRIRQKPDEESSQHLKMSLQSRRKGFRSMIEGPLRFIENLQRRSHEAFMKRASEERAARPDSRWDRDARPRLEGNEGPLLFEKRRNVPRLRGKSILIVDDEKNICLTLSQTFEVLEAEIDLAANGDEALAKLKEKGFDLMLLDIRMPGMSGMEVLRHARKIRPDTRIIMVTAYGTVRYAVEALKLGACEFIEKPFIPDEIRQLVSGVMDGKTTNSQRGDSLRPLC